MDWIDIKQHLPEFDTTVLFYGGERVAVGRLVSKTLTKDSEYLEFYEHDKGYDLLWFTPTHWMYLPQSPPSKRHTPLNRKI